ncbi:hypothetical protein [Streptomyces sp. NPDC004685]
MAIAGLLAGAVAALPAPYAHASDHAVRVPCSVAKLAAAIRTANASPGADTLRLASKCTYRLTDPDGENPANGLPEITSEITIDGRGATLTRGRKAPRFRIFAVPATGTLTLDHTTVSGGDATDCPIFGEGVCGGGIAAIGALNLNHSKVKDNTARSAAFAEGGGVHAGGPTTVNQSELSHNTVVYNGKEPGSAVGGGILTMGPLTMTKTKMVRNSVSAAAGTGSFAFGAGIVAFAQATIHESVVSDNVSSAPGGFARAALAAAAAAPENVKVTSTVVRGNVSSAPDGNAAGGGVAANFPLVMKDVTISDNTSSAPRGTALAGGLQVGPSGDVDISHSAVRGNKVIAEGGTAQGGGIATAGTLKAAHVKVTRNAAIAPNGTAEGGGIFKASGTITSDDTVVRANTPDNCRPVGAVPGCTG